jgi:hypothetical protein
MAGLRQPGDIPQRDTMVVHVVCRLDQGQRVLGCALAAEARRRVLDRHCLLGGGSRGRGEGVLDVMHGGLDTMLGVAGEGGHALVWWHMEELEHHLEHVVEDLVHRQGCTRQRVAAVLMNKV